MSSSRPSWRSINLSTPAAARGEEQSEDSSDSYDSHAASSDLDLSDGEDIMTEQEKLVLASASKRFHASRLAQRSSEDSTRDDEIEPGDSSAVFDPAIFELVTAEMEDESGDELDELPTESQLDPGAFQYGGDDHDGDEVDMMGETLLPSETQLDPGRRSHIHGSPGSTIKQSLSIPSTSQLDPNPEPHRPVDTRSSGRNNYQGDAEEDGDDNNDESSHGRSDEDGDMIPSESQLNPQDSDRGDDVSNTVLPPDPDPHPIREPLFLSGSEADSDFIEDEDDGLPPESQLNPRSDSARSEATPFIKSEPLSSPHLARHREGQEGLHNDDGEREYDEEEHGEEVGEEAVEADDDEAILPSESQLAPVENGVRDLQQGSSLLPNDDNQDVFFDALPLPHTVVGDTVKLVPNPASGVAQPGTQTASIHMPSQPAPQRIISLASRFSSAMITQVTNTGDIDSPARPGNQAAFFAHQRLEAIEGGRFATPTPERNVSAAEGEDQSTVLPEETSYAALAMGKPLRGPRALSPHPPSLTSHRPFTREETPEELVPYEPDDPQHAQIDEVATHTGSFYPEDEDPFNPVTAPIQEPQSQSEQDRPKIDLYMCDVDKGPLIEDPRMVLPEGYRKPRSILFGTVPGKISRYVRKLGPKKWSEAESVLLYREVQKVPMTEPNPCAVVEYFYGEFAHWTPHLKFYNAQHMKDKMRTIVNARRNQNLPVVGRARHFLPRGHRDKKAYLRELNAAKKLQFEHEAEQIWEQHAEQIAQEVQTREDEEEAMENEGAFEDGDPLDDPENQDQLEADVRSTRRKGKDMAVIRIQQEAIASPQARHKQGAKARSVDVDVTDTGLAISSDFPEPFSLDNLYPHVASRPSSAPAPSPMSLGISNEVHSSPSRPDNGGDPSQQSDRNGEAARGSSPAQLSRKVSITRAGSSRISQPGSPVQGRSATTMENALELDRSPVESSDIPADSPTRTNHSAEDISVGGATLQPRSPSQDRSVSLERPEPGHSTQRRKIVRTYKRPPGVRRRIQSDDVSDESLSEPERLVNIRKSRVAVVIPVRAYVEPETEPLARRTRSRRMDTQIDSTHNDKSNQPEGPRSRRARSRRAGSGLDSSKTAATRSTSRRRNLSDSESEPPSKRTRSRAFGSPDPSERSPAAKRSSRSKKVVPNEDDSDMAAGLSSKRSKSGERTPELDNSPKRKIRGVRKAAHGRAASSPTVATTARPTQEGLADDHLADGHLEQEPSINEHDGEEDKHDEVEGGQDEVDFEDNTQGVTRRSEMARRAMITNAVLGGH